MGENKHEMCALSSDVQVHRVTSHNSFWLHLIVFLLHRCTLEVANKKRNDFIGLETSINAVRYSVHRCKSAQLNIALIISVLRHKSMHRPKRISIKMPMWLQSRTTYFLLFSCNRWNRRFDHTLHQYFAKTDHYRTRVLLLKVRGFSRNYPGNAVDDTTTFSLDHVFR